MLRNRISNVGFTGRPTFSSGHLFHLEFHLLFGFWYRFQFLCSNQYLLCQASLPGCPVLFNPFFFCLSKGRRIAILWACKACRSPRRKEKRAISRPFAIATRAARLYTAWFRYRSYVVVELKSSIPAIPECLLYSARSFARSKQDEVALLRRQGSFRTLLTSSCSTRPYL